MAQHIKSPTLIKAAGNKPKIIKEFIGRVNSSTEELSIAQMESPSGWVEPGQSPEFDVTKRANRLSHLPASGCNTALQG